MTPTFCRWYTLMHSHALNCLYFDCSSTDMGSFLIKQLSIKQHWLTWWLGTALVTSRYLKQWLSTLLTNVCHYASMRSQSNVRPGYYKLLHRNKACHSKTWMVIMPEAMSEVVIRGQSHMQWYIIHCNQDLELATPQATCHVVMTEVSLILHIYLHDHIHTVLRTHTYFLGIFVQICHQQQRFRAWINNILWPRQSFHHFADAFSSLEIFVFL